MTPVQVAWLITASAALAGCASLINGTSQDVTITSDPPGAQVSILTGIDRFGLTTEMNRMKTVSTPGRLRLSRVNSYLLLVEKPGYVPHEVSVPQRYSRWAYLDLLAVLLDLMVVNETTGGLYAFDDIHVTLVPEAAGSVSPSP